MGKPDGKSSGGQDQWALDLAERLAERDISCQGSGQTPRVEALADGSRVAGLMLDNRRSERLQPLDRLVQPLDDLALQGRVPARAFLLEGFERSVAPDDAAREEHRAAGPIALLQHDGLGPELPRPCGGGQAGHARTGYHQVGYLSANVGFCSTYSIFTRSGPQ